MKPTQRNVLIRWACLFILFLMTATAVQAQDAFKVIVNPANVTDQLTKTDVERLFLKKTTKWSDGSSVLPVDLPTGAAVRESFTKVVLDRSVAAVSSYWQQAVFSGKGVPPPVKSNDADVLEFVKENPGAIGYVSTGADTAGVKVVEVK